VRALIKIKFLRGKTGCDETYSLAMSKWSSVTYERATMIDLTPWFSDTAPMAANGNHIPVGYAAIMSKKHGQNRAPLTRVSGSLFSRSLCAMAPATTLGRDSPETRRLVSPASRSLGAVSRRGRGSRAGRAPPPAPPGAGAPPSRRLGPVFALARGSRSPPAGAGPDRPPARAPPPFCSLRGARSRGAAAGLAEDMVKSSYSEQGHVTAEELRECAEAGLITCSRHSEEFPRV
jgi:hypothetical protein